MLHNIDFPIEGHHSTTGSDKNNRVDDEFQSRGTAGNDSLTGILTNSILMCVYASICDTMRFVALL